MGLGTGATAAIVGGIGAAGSIGSALIGSNAAGNAANAQTQAANHAADLQKQEADQALAFNQKVFDTNQSNAAPWIKAGQQAVGNLTQLGQQPFQAPTGATEQNDPGFQFRLQQGQQALERSAAARGGVLSGGTAKAIARYGQDYASNEYGNVYNRALTQYQIPWNQQASLAGLGQTSAGQAANSANQSASTNANIALTSGQQQGNAIQNAGAATASGYVGSGNAWSGALGNLSNLGSTLALLNAGKNPTESVTSTIIP